jgi:hypothetical protein
VPMRCERKRRNVRSSQVGIYSKAFHTNVTKPEFRLADIL